MRPKGGTLDKKEWGERHPGSSEWSGGTGPGTSSEQEGIQVGEQVVNSCPQSFAHTLLEHSAIVMQNPGQLCSWVDGVGLDLLHLVPALLA